jgi:hypothetical protein
MIEHCKLQGLKGLINYKLEMELEMAVRIKESVMVLLFLHHSYRRP